MKTTILLFAVIFGYITPTYSQLNRQRKTDTTIEQLQNNKNDDFGNYKFDKFSNFQYVANKTRTKPIHRNIFSGQHALFPPKVRGQDALSQTNGYIPYESLQT
jgi:hypothetical protein